jgi:hypothetical protein
MFEHKEQAEAVVLNVGPAGMVVDTDLHGHDWDHHHYILEVRPAGQQPFRVETKAKVPIFSKPREGDSVTVSFDPKSHKTEIHITGDPRYDPQLRHAASKQREKEREQALLNGAPVVFASGDSASRHNLDAARDRADNAAHWRLPPDCPECGAKVDPSMASKAEHPQCTYCGASIPSNRVHRGDY